MRWRGILVSLKHAHSANLSSASVVCSSKATFWTLWSRPSTVTSRSASLPNQVRAASTSVLVRKPVVVKNIVTETSPAAKVFSSPQLKRRSVRPLETKDKERFEIVDSKVKRSQVQSKVDLKGVTVSQNRSGNEALPPDGGKNIKTEKVTESKQKGNTKAVLQGVPLEDCSSSGDNATLGHVGPPEDAPQFESGHTFINQLSNDPSVATASEGEEISSEEVGDGSKKTFYTVSFPVSVLSEWWQFCLIRNARTYGSLRHPLFKIHVWLAAYQRAHRDATGTYTDGQSAAILMQQLCKIRSAVANGNFRWSDNNNIYLSWPVVCSEEEESKMSKTDVNPNFQDSVVQEVLYLVLEPIFETRFSARSHACRPGRDICTALQEIKTSFSGCTWFVMGHLGILHERAYAPKLVDRVLRFVKDPRITYLLKSIFLRHGISNQGSCSNLRHLLCNVFLDQLDWWMDEQILSLSKREDSAVGSSSLFKAAKSSTEKLRKLEYIRYGTEFLVACNGSEEDAEVLKHKIEIFLQQWFGCDPRLLQISHISVGVPFLDHIVSQKVVRRTILRRKSSSGRVCDKRDVRIRLCFRASRESCLLNLQKVGSPTDVQDITKMLSVLRCWYHCVENKERLIDYCRFMLCLWYAKGNCKKDKGRTMDHDLARRFNEAMEMVLRDSVEDGATGEDTCDWVESKRAFRSYAWLQNETIMTQVKSTFQKMQSLPPQQHMSQIMCQYLAGGYGVKNDNGWELESQMQASNRSEALVTGLSDKELAKSMG